MKTTRDNNKVNHGLSQSNRTHGQEARNDKQQALTAIRAREW